MYISWIIIKVDICNWLVHIYVYGGMIYMILQWIYGTWIRNGRQVFWKIWCLQFWCADAGDSERKKQHTFLPPGMVFGAFRMRNESSQISLLLFLHMSEGIDIWYCYWFRRGNCGVKIMVWGWQMKAWGAHQTWKQQRLVDAFRLHCFVSKNLLETGLPFKQLCQCWAMRLRTSPRRSSHCLPTTGMDPHTLNLYLDAPLTASLSLHFTLDDSAFYFFLIFLYMFMHKLHLKKRSDDTTLRSHNY